MGEVENWIIILNINYCLDVISNLLLIDKFIRKGCWYIGKEKKSELYCPDNDIIFKGIFISDNIYMLNLHNNRRLKSSPIFLKIS